MATTLLTCPKEQVSFKSLNQITGNIFSHLNETKRVVTYIPGPIQNYDIEQVALNLGFSVKGKPSDRKKGGLATVNLSKKEDNLLMLSMSYYKNQLSNFYVEETIVTHAISYLIVKNQDEKPVVPLADVVRVSQQLMEIFRSEFIQF